MQVWGRNRDWLIIAVTLLCIKTLLDSRKLLIHNSEKLLLCIIFSSLSFLNFSIFIRLKKEMVMREKRFENNPFLNLKDTNLSFYKLRENSGWGVSNDVVEVGRIIKSKLDNKKSKAKIILISSLFPLDFPQTTYFPNRKTLFFLDEKYVQ